MMIRLSSVFLGFIVMSLFFVGLGKNPIDVYKAMLEGCFGSPYRIKETIRLMIPLAIISLGLIIAFKMKFWNIGAEGQILMGAMGASYVALNFHTLPKVLVLLLMIIASIVCGGIWSMIPAFFKSKYATNETLFTLMLNYIALKWVIFLQYGPWKDPKAFGFPKVPNFEDSALLPQIGGLHIGWIFLLILMAAIYIMMHKSKFGYEISVIGESENTARYAGIHVSKITLKAIFLSGGIAGLVGMIQVSGVSSTLNYEISAGMGYTAIIVTWLANMKIAFIPIVAFLFAVLSQGASYIQTAFQIPQSAAEILQGIILLFALGGEFFIHYKIYPVHKDKASKEVA
jgi:simple sugar transport system permease protein